MAEATKALQVVTLADASMVPLAAPEIRAYLDAKLKGRKVTAEDLLLDMAAQMTANPKLKLCTTQSLYGCLVFAARHGKTFGPGGVWIVPRNLKDKDGESESKTPTAQPQLDYRAMEDIAVERFGLAPPLTVEFVYGGEKARIVKQNGVTIGVEHELDPARNRSQVDFLWGYCVAQFKDGRLFIYTMDRETLEKRRKASAAKDGDAWTKWGIEMYGKSIIRKAMTVLVQDFTIGVGSGGGAEPTDLGEDSGEPRDITAEANAAAQRPALTQSQKLVEDLRGQGGKPEEAGPKVAPAAPTPSASAGGYTEVQLTQIKNAIADQALKGEKHLVNWVAQEYPGWVQTGGKDQAAELIKERDILIKQIRASG